MKKEAAPSSAAPARYLTRLLRAGTQEAPRKRGFLSDGASRARTGDLLDANEALFQLSYSPQEPKVYPDPLGRLTARA